LQRRIHIDANQYEKVQMELCLLHIRGEFECFGVYFGRTYPKAVQAVFFQPF